MSKVNEIKIFRVHYTVDNVKKIMDIEAFKPEQAIQSVRNHYQGKQCIVNKVKVLKEDKNND